MTHHRMDCSTRERSPVIELGSIPPNPTSTPHECIDSSIDAPNLSANDGDRKDSKSDAKGGKKGVEGDGREEAEDETRYPGPAAMAIIMVAISLAMFLVSLVRPLDFMSVVSAHPTVGVVSTPRAKRAREIHHTPFWSFSHSFPKIHGKAR
jgi:hypothetical protein